ncbi:hypothetical protein [Lactococcus lactis]
MADTGYQVMQELDVQDLKFHRKAKAATINLGMTSILLLFT